MEESLESIESMIPCVRYTKRRSNQFANEFQSVLAKSLSEKIARWQKFQPIEASTLSVLYLSFRNSNVHIYGVLETALETANYGGFYSVFVCCLLPLNQAVSHVEAMNVPYGSILASSLEKSGPGGLGRNPASPWLKHVETL